MVGTTQRHDPLPLKRNPRHAPFLIAYGDNDFPHLIAQAETMETALNSAGGDVSSLVLEGCDHLQASLATGDPKAPWVGAAVDWMRRH